MIVMVELSFFHGLSADKWHGLVMFQELYVEYWFLVSSEIFNTKFYFWTQFEEQRIFFIKTKYESLETI